MKSLKTLKKTKGFTLVELIVVIVIIGILAAVAVPAYQGYVSKSRSKTLNATQTLLRNSVSMFHSENEAYPTADEICCETGDLLPSNFTFVPLNPYCDQTQANKTFSDSGFTTLEEFGWGYTAATGAIAPDYSDDDCTSP